MSDQMVPRSFGTHDGTFHADEVTACALLLLFDLIDGDKVHRTRDPNILASCEYVCDVGGIYNPSLKRFDHHQADYTGDLSSAGMVWSYLKSERIIDDATYLFFNRSLIIGIDAHDNGKVSHDIGTCSFSQVVSNFVPPFYDAETEVQNEAFHEALNFVFNHLKRLLARYNYIKGCKQMVADSMKLHKDYLLFETPIPWLESFFELGGEEHPALFVVMPSGGHWKLRGIPPDSEQRMKVRMPLPSEWAGLRDDALVKASGIRGAIFCHKGRFISVWETREDAMQALNYVLRSLR